MMSLWESEAAAMTARPVLGPLVKDLPFSDWDSQPPEQLVNLVRAIQHGVREGRAKSGAPLNFTINIATIEAAQRG